MILRRCCCITVSIRPGAGRWYGRCRGYGDMGREEIGRLRANVWASPAFLPEGGPGAGVRTAALFRDPFRDLFQGADPITSDQYCRVPRIRAAASARVSIGANAFAEFCRSVLPGCVPGVSRSDHIRSIRSGPRRPEDVRELHGSGRCTLPFRGGTIEGRPAGGGPGFFRDGRHVSG